MRLSTNYYMQSVRKLFYHHRITKLSSFEVDGSWFSRFVWIGANLSDNSDKAAFLSKKDSCAGVNREPIRHKAGKFNNYLLHGRFGITDNSPLEYAAAVSQSFGQGGTENTFALFKCTSGLEFAATEVRTASWTRRLFRERYRIWMVFTRIRSSHCSILCL